MLPLIISYNYEIVYHRQKERESLKSPFPCCFDRFFSFLHFLMAYFSTKSEAVAFRCDCLFLSSVIRSEPEEELKVLITEWLRKYLQTWCYHQYYSLSTALYQLKLQAYQIELLIPECICNLMGLI